MVELVAETEAEPETKVLYLYLGTTERAIIEALKEYVPINSIRSVICRGITLASRIHRNEERFDPLFLLGYLRASVHVDPTPQDQREPLNLSIPMYLYSDLAMLAHERGISIQMMIRQTIQGFGYTLEQCQYEFRTFLIPGIEGHSFQVVP